MRVFIRNDRLAPADAVAAIAIADARGETTLDLVASARVAAGTSAELTANGTLAGARPWSPNSPVLYTAVVRLKDPGGEVDSVQTRFGFRRVEATPEGLRLNGQPIFLTGFNRHEDSPRTAMAVDRQTTREDLTRIKEAGANFVRLCHYPHHPFELDLCDEIGLLVLDEIPLNLRIDAARAETAARQIRRMIERDRNHPSVIFWSVGNETYDEDTFAAEANRGLLRLARELDPSRLCVHVSNRWRTSPNFEEDDVICVNDYPSMTGWRGRRGHGPQADLSRSAEAWRTSLATLHERYPLKPILISEFGYCSIAGTNGHALGEDMHERVIRAEFPALDAPFLCGVSLWCWADHPWPPAGFLDGMAMSPFGVHTRQRVPKKAFGAIRSLYRARQVVSAYPRINRGQNLRPGRVLPSPTDTFARAVLRWIRRNRPENRKNAMPGPAGGCRGGLHPNSAVFARKRGRSRVKVDSARSARGRRGCLTTE